MAIITEEDCFNHGMQERYQGMDRTFIVVVAAYHRRQKSMGDYCSRVPQRLSGVTGVAILCPGDSSGRILKWLSQAAK